MAIFSRRSLQRLLVENSEFLRPAQTKTHVEALNRMEKELTLAREWEVVLLNSLHKRGKVVHEKDFGGANRADVYWESRENPSHNFVADITAASDQGLDKQNPYDALSAELNKILRSRNLSPSAFFLRVGADNKGHYKGGAKVKLKIPGRASFGKRVFGPQLNSFLDKISQNTTVPDKFLIKTDEIDLEIRYNPRQQYGGGSHLDYKVVYRLTDNVVYNALSAKASQLAGTNFNGPSGIFLCDGGCRFLDGQTLDSQRSYTLTDVIAQFLHEHTEISFVATFVVKKETPSTIGIPVFDRNPYRVFVDLFPNASCARLEFDLFDVLKQLVFPHPRLNAANAMNQLKWANEWNKPHQGIYQYGGISVAQNRTTIKMSARKLLELFSGKISEEEFLRHHHFLTVENPFEEALNAGQLAVSLERCDEDDDDFIIFEMGGPDAAIARFLASRKGK